MIDRHHITNFSFFLNFILTWIVFFFPLSFQYSKFDEFNDQEKIDRFYFYAFCRDNLSIHSQYIQSYLHQFRMLKRLLIKNENTWKIKTLRNQLDF